MKQHLKIDKKTILDSYDSEKIKTVDLTDVLSRFSELFSVIPFEPESKKASELDPNDALLPPPVYPPKKNESVNTMGKPKVVIPKSPFSNSSIVEDPTFRGWHYIDESDIIQGPFTSLEMDSWFDQGYLFNELLIKYENGTEFRSLIDMFGKVEYPPKDLFQVTRKLERRVSAKGEDELPSLTMSKAVSYNENQSYKPRFQRGSIHRFSLEENSDVLLKNVWQNFLEKKPEEAHHPENVVEQKSKLHEVSQPKTQTESVPSNIQKESTEITTQEKFKTSEHKEINKKMQSQAEDAAVKQEQPSLKKETSETKSKMPEKEGEYVKLEESHNENLEVNEEKKTSKKSKKEHSSPKNQTLSEQHLEQGTSHYQAHTSTRDKRSGKGKYQTVFEPKIEHSEIKDKAQDSHPKDDSRYSTSKKAQTDLKSSGAYSKNAQFFA